MDALKTEIVVVGAGPGGYAAAFYAADLGKKVVLVERDKRLGGVCLNRGCIPSKALLHAAHVITAARESESRGITFAAPTIEVAKLRSWKESVLTRLAGGIANWRRCAASRWSPGGVTLRIQQPCAWRPKEASNSSLMT